MWDKVAESLPIIRMQTGILCGPRVRDDEEYAGRDPRIHGVEPLRTYCGFHVGQHGFQLLDVFLGRAVQAQGNLKSMG